ncbi:hypothetical protein HYU11_05515 [Candidatus Woesearchaeota archaeon]|nr:hypothetical protein [Candidatus Woesearchaeota archaeon]
MANRKKRLKKGIESIERQILLHEEKLELAKANDDIGLTEYYQKEIEAKKRDKDEKKRLLDKGG